MLIAFEIPSPRRLNQQLDGLACQRHESTPSPELRLRRPEAALRCGPRILRMNKLQRARSLPGGLACSGASHCAVVLPTASSHRSPVCRRQQRMDRNSSTEAPEFKSHADVSYIPSETMNELLNKIK
jgi:hypothetical protein